MKQNNYKPQIPDVLEAIFDVAYLIFDLIAALLFFFFSQGESLIYPLRNPDSDSLRSLSVSSGTTNPESCTRKQ